MPQARIASVVNIDNVFVLLERQNATPMKRFQCSCEGGPIEKQRDVAMRTTDLLHSKMVYAGEL